MDNVVISAYLKSFFVKIGIVLNLNHAYHLGFISKSHMQILVQPLTTHNIEPRNAYPDAVFISMKLEVEDLVVGV